jgi:uncharacterized phage protein (TIGR02216 family)
MSEGFPWARLMQLGFGQLRLAPRDFWSMTLKELNAALPRLHPMARRELERLMERFPDDHLHD